MEHKVLRIGVAMFLVGAMLFLALTLLARQTQAQGGSTIYMALGGNCRGLNPCYSPPQDTVDTSDDDPISPITIIATAIPTLLSKPCDSGLTATNIPQQPTLPMVLDGFVYVNRVKAEDGTLVEAKIEGVAVASDHTSTREGLKGYYVLRFPGNPGDEVHLFVEGEEANESPVEWEMGSKTLNLTVGPLPLTYTLTMTVTGSGRTDPPVGTHSQLKESIVIIRAVADEGSKFYGWIGDVADPDSDVTWVIMDGDKTVTAKFIVVGVIYLPIALKSCSP